MERAHESGHFRPFMGSCLFHHELKVKDNFIVHVVSFHCISIR